MFILKNNFKNKAGFAITTVLLVIAGIGVIAGGTYYFKKEGNNEPEKAEQIIQKASNLKVREEIDRETASIEDIGVGSKVSIAGTLDQGGFVSANIIFLGDLPDKNIPPEETRNKGKASGKGTATDREAVMITGEILEKDGESFVVLFDNGSSKLIYYTDKVKVFK